MATKKQLTPEEFSALPKKEQKVLVAKDVIAQIKKKKYNPETGSYIKQVYQKGEYMGEMYTINAEKNSLQKALPSISKCTVCALGACILSTTKFKNVLSVHDVGGGVGNFTRTTDNLLQSIFTKDELGKMECLFEGTANENTTNYASHRLGWGLPQNDKLYRDFLEKYPDDKERLIVIMTQIIKDNGKIILKNFKNL